MHAALALLFILVDPAPPPTRPSAATPATPSAATPATPSAPTPATPPADALAEYQRLILNVEDVPIVSEETTARVVAFTQGRYRQPLEIPDFLQAIGRTEAAETYRTRRALSGVLAAGAFGSMLIGVLSLATGDPGGDCGSPSDPRFSPCVQAMVHDRQTSRIGGPLAFSAVAAALLFTGAMVAYPARPDPVEMRRLADEHNQALARRLGIREASAPGPAPGSGGPRPRRRRRTGPGRAGRPARRTFRPAGRPSPSC
jgi:hypothetical protein